MYARNPHALREKDSKGLLPIHSAICHQAPLDMIEIILSLYPQGIFERDNFGRTPLDISMKLRRCAHGKLIYKLLKNTWGRVGTPFARTLHSFVSYYNASRFKALKKDRERKLLIQSNF